MKDPRFFIDHDVIHDRVTGKHVRSTPDDGFEDGITALLDLLNSLVLAVELAGCKGCPMVPGADGDLKCPHCGNCQMP